MQYLIVEWILYWRRKKNAFIKDITGPTDKTGTWTEDLMNALYQYEFTEVDNCAVVI